MAQKELQLVISPNCVISRTGLMVNGKFELIGHSGQFMQLVQMTAPAVASVLAEIFPEAVAVPDASGNAVGSFETAAEHYTRHAHYLQTLLAASDEAISVSRTLLQWCVAASAAAEAGQLPVGDTPEFLAVNYLIEHGAKAASCSMTQWHAHAVWLQEERTLEAFLAHMDGRGKKSPLPGPLRVIAPWPGHLGAKLGDAQAEKAALFLGTDVMHDGAHTLCRFQGHSLRLTSTIVQDWVAQVDAAAEGEKSKFFDYALQDNHDGIDYTFRVQRTKTDAGTLYAFRQLSSAVPEVSALFQ